MRLAWFSPLPPHRSGIAAYCAALLPRLAGGHTIDAYVDDTDGRAAVASVTPIPGVRVAGAHDFVWEHVLRPYDLTVFQLGNETCHHYMWPYLVHAPGLVLLHDAQLHQARARALILQHREDDYLAEFRYSHPDTDPGVADLILAGLGGSLYYFWPMVRVPIEAARMVAVHSAGLARDLRDDYPGRAFAHVRQGYADITPRARATPAEVRRRHAIPDDAVIFASFGRVTPEKQLTTVLMALAQVASDVPLARLLVVGDPPADDTLGRAARDLGLADRIAITGYVADDVLPEYLAAADVCLNLRWPTARETSGAWIRCLAAGKSTIVSDLAHQTDIPSLDLRSGNVQCTTFPAPEAVCVAVDLLDDVHMLRLALRRLATDDRLRTRLGAAARRYWQREATLDVMVADYEAALTQAAQTPAPETPAGWPTHLTGDGTATLRAVIDKMGVEMPFEPRVPSLKSRK
jgi:glycosyltransferase involved in cell wall biosynthesis